MIGRFLLTVALLVGLVFPAETTYQGHPCGGDLPPCWVLRREQGPGRVNVHAYNRTGCRHADGSSGCFGKWQFDPRTGDGTGTEKEQDDEARRVWNHGRGCRHWAAC